MRVIKVIFSLLNAFEPVSKRCPSSCLKAQLKNPRGNRNSVFQIKVKLFSALLANDSLYCANVPYMANGMQLFALYMLQPNYELGDGIIQVNWPVITKTPYQLQYVISGN